LPHMESRIQPTTMTNNPRNQVVRNGYCNTVFGLQTLIMPLSSWMKRSTLPLDWIE
jgi:hypothetical protein